MTELCNAQFAVAPTTGGTDSEARRAARDVPSAAPRVLFVSYEFPPVGGAGVQRVTKFVKYLPRKGWSVSVLTVKNPSVPVSDSSLSADVPPETIVRKARTLEPGYRVKAAVSAGGVLGERRTRPMRSMVKKCVREVANAILQPDPQILWAPNAIREGLKLLREIPHSAIVASAPPFSSLLIGAALSRRTGVPLVLDYRDEWGISNVYRENRRTSRLSQIIQNSLQRKAVKAASVLIATTPSSGRSLEFLRDKFCATARVEYIYNGFDPDDFANSSSDELLSTLSTDGFYRLAYIGTLWNLTDAAPLVTAVELLSKTRPEIARRLELVFAGRRTGPQEMLLSRLEGLPCKLVRLPYVNHGEAMRLLRSASGLCVLLANTPDAGRVVPAKIFEYMAALRPIVAIAPRGELWDIVAKIPGGTCLLPTDPTAIADALAKEIERKERGDAVDLPALDSSEFSREIQTQVLSDILGSILRPVTKTRGMQRSY